MADEPEPVDPQAVSASMPQAASSASLSVGFIFPSQKLIHHNSLRDMFEMGPKRAGLRGVYGIPVSVHLRRNPAVDVAFDQCKWARTR
ncbi:MAG TPA: hypothetical protein DDZ43_15205 [Hyphomonadaceae bacterium]|nr:hypothetical protein [Hyphomonadaceae bacterium]